MIPATSTPCGQVRLQVWHCLQSIRNELVAALSGSLRWMKRSTLRGVSAARKATSQYAEQYPHWTQGAVSSLLTGELSDVLCVGSVIERVILQNYTLNGLGPSSFRSSIYASSIRTRRALSCISTLSERTRSGSIIIVVSFSRRSPLRFCTNRLPLT